MEHLVHLVHTLASFALVLGVLVSIHEMGHYLAARWCGVHAEVFSLGFGPALKSWTDRRGTEWRISLLPLGGYVRMHGMTPDAQAAAEEAGLPYYPDAAYSGKPVASRALIAAAGPIANFLLAMVLFAGLQLYEGRALTDAKGQTVALPVVDQVLPDSAAAKAGLRPGDDIVAVNGAPIQHFDELRSYVEANVGHDLSLGVLRGTQHLVLIAHIPPPTAGGTGKLGVTSALSVTEPVSFAAAVVGGVTETWETLAAMVVGLAHIVTTGAGVRDLGGPIMIAHLSGEVADRGITSMIKFIALLSVNLGLVNLLPIPVLDGGHLMFYAAEALRGRPVPARAQEYGYRVGIAFIVCVFVLISFNDLKNQGAFLWVQHLMG
jgi:regulator of sigma E protease